jgi:hypothetical protein
MTLRGHSGSVEEGSVTDVYFVKVQRKLVPPVLKLFPSILARDHREEISVNPGVLRWRNLRFNHQRGKVKGRRPFHHDVM